MTKSDPLQSYCRDVTTIDEEHSKPVGSGGRLEVKNFPLPLVLFLLLLLLLYALLFSSFVGRGIIESIRRWEAIDLHTRTISAKVTAALELVLTLLSTVRPVRKK